MAKWWETLGQGLPELGTTLAWGRGARRERRETDAEKKKKEAEAKTAKDLDLEYLLHGTVGGVKPFADVRAEKDAEAKAAYPTALIDNPFYREKAPGEREAWLAGLTGGKAPGGFTTETPMVPREILPYTAKNEPQTLEDKLALLLAGVNARTEGQIKVKGMGRGGGGPKLSKGFTNQDIALLSKIDAGDSKKTDDEKIASILVWKPGHTVEEAKNALNIARSASPFTARPPADREQPAQFQYEYSRQATEAAKRFANNPGKYKNNFEGALREVNKEMGNVMYGDVAAWVKARRRKSNP
jgi:hypothetical protein